MGDIVRYKDVFARKRLQSAIALTVVFWVLLIGGEAALPWSQGPDDHAPHAVATALADEFAVVMDHPHFQQGSAALSPDTFAIAVLPRVVPVLVALGLALAVVAGWMWGRGAVWATVRGPPRALAPFTSGRQLLAHFCISRR